MTQNGNEQKEQPKPRKKMSAFLKALLWTAIPILGLSAISVIAAIASSGRVAFGGSVVGMLCVLALLVSIGFIIAGKRRVAAGILAGVGIGLVGLGLTCFAANAG